MLIAIMLFVLSSIVGYLDCMMLTSGANVIWPWDQKPDER